MSDQNQNGRATMTIMEEAIRRSDIIDGPGYEFPGRLSRIDVITAIAIATASFLGVYFASKV